jgi:prepilin-type processing-associated H-X9-DG protein
MSRHLRSVSAVCVFILCVLVNRAAAQPLADRIPEDAIVYMGWQGTQEIAGFEQTHFKAVMEDWGLFDNLEKIMVQAAPETAEPDDDLAALRFAISCLRIMYDRPTAFYLGVNGDEMRFAVLCDAGTEAQRLETDWKQMLADTRVGVSEKPVLQRVGNVVMLLVGTYTEAERATLMGQAGTPSLKTSAGFVASMNEVGTQAQALVFHINMERLHPLMEKLVAESSPEKTQAALFTQLMTDLGIWQMQSVTMAGRFVGRDWQEEGFLAIAGPRKGLMAMFSDKPLDPAVIAFAPRTAQWLTAGRVDLSILPQLVMDALRTMESDAEADMQKDLAELNAMLGIDVMSTMKATGDQWLVYGDPSMAGMLGVGFLAVNWARDGAVLADNLDKAALAINAELIRNRGPRLASTDVDGGKIHFLNFPMVSPAVGVHQNRAYLALSPQIIATRIALLSMQLSPIVDSAEYQALLKALNPPKPIAAITYSDLRQTAPIMIQSASSLLSIAQMGMLDQGDDAPDFMALLPRIDKIMPHLSPAMDVSWVDDKGLHTRAISPFPMSTALSPASSLTSTSPALLAGVLLPSIGRARVVADRTVSAANLSGLYKAMYTWSVTHNDKFPDDLAVLVEDGSISAKSLFKRPKSLPDLPIKELARWAADNSDFVYRAGKVSADSPADAIVMFERLTPGNNEGINILFADGHVEFVELPEALELLEKAGEPIPEMFKDAVPQGDE